MPGKDALRVAAVLAKGMAAMCFRNTVVEDFHDGIASVGQTGDFSDVAAIDADERRIPWQRSRSIEPDEMCDSMRKVADRQYTCNLNAGDPDFFNVLNWAVAEAREWDAPEPDEGMLRSLEAKRRQEGAPGV